MDANLRQALQLARESMLTDPGFDLSLGHRRHIWSKLGTTVEGSKRRTHLAISCVKKVAHLWDQYFSADSTVRMLISTADALALGTYDKNSGMRVRDAGWKHMDDLARNNQSLQSVVCVGYAAAQLVGTAINDEDFDETNNLAITDRDVDPDEFDCATLCAASQAGGFVWNKTSNRDKRREFWLWYRTRICNPRKPPTPKSD